MDGSEYFSSDKVRRERCLTATKGVRYLHDILLTAMVHPDKRQVHQAGERTAERDLHLRRRSFLHVPADWGGA